MLAGSITTVGSMLFLLWAPLVINNKFATLIFVTILASFLMTMVLFGAIMHVVGP